MLKSHIFFLGFILIDKSREIEKNRSSTIFNWYESDFIFEIQSFLRFANFYYRFVEKYLSIIHLLIRIINRITKRTKKIVDLRKIYFFDFEDLKIFSSTGNNIGYLAIFGLLCCKTANKAMNWRFKLFNFYNLIWKAKLRKESLNLLNIESNWR